MTSRLTYVAADETDLNSLLEGRSAGVAVPWKGGGARPRDAQFGVLLDEQVPGKPRPRAIIAQSSEHRRMFSRYATLRSDLSPLSAWCHVFEPEQFERLKEPLREADLRGLTGAWSGLSIAEAVLLADRPIGQIRLAACLATQSFAVARMVALWDRVSLEETLGRQSEAVRLINGRDDRRSRLEERLRPIWESLLSAGGLKSGGGGGSFRVIEAIRRLGELREARNGDEASQLKALFENIEEANFLIDMENRSPEDRVRAFDTLVKASSQTDLRDVSRRSELVFLAGYLATVVAGGSASLTLTTESAKSIPEITAWAYAIGGLGEHVLWTSSFEGLGRLVARELERPFHIDEAPLSDIALDEAAILVDRELSDPLVRLRFKQTRVATVSLLPGVNVAVPLKEVPGSDSRRSPQVSTPEPSQPDFMTLLAMELWPRIEALLEERERSSGSSGRPQNRRRKGGQAKLL